MSIPGSISAAVIEDYFGRNPVVFATFCNAVIAAKATRADSGYPVLSEKPGPDGSFDGEWRIKGEKENGIAIPGWNVFQFKARGLAGATRKATITALKGDLKGAALDVSERLQAKGGSPVQYILFTNLQLGLETPTVTEGGAVLSVDRQKIITAIREGSAVELCVTVLDAGNLAAEVNANASLRLTFFAGPATITWDAKRQTELAVNSLHASVPFVGRDRELKQLAEWIDDASVSVIAISGPQGMGKTRLALEATSVHRSRVAVVDIPEELSRWPIDALAGSGLPTILLIEDPDEDLAMRLAKQAITRPGVKLLLTVPSPDRAPQFALSGHPAVKVAQLGPLDGDGPANLLKSTKAKLDTTAIDWILQQAGGVPDVILNAAFLGSGLREGSTSLKAGLANKYRAKIEKEFGPDAQAALNLVSPLQWVKFTGEKNEIPLLIAVFGSALNPLQVEQLLKRLSSSGFIRIRGEFAMVTPPLFAAALAETVFQVQPANVRMLWDRLDNSGRTRMLERAVTLEIGEDNPFWDHVFAGVTASTVVLRENLSFLSAMARGAPKLTAHAIETHLHALVAIAGEGVLSELDSVAREITYNASTCSEGMRLLESLALLQPAEAHLSSAEQRFADCFVHWYYEFPMAFDNRADWLEHLTSSPESARRLLGTKALVHASSVPNNLSGHNVAVRKLGSAPKYPKWTDVYTYLGRIFALRFKLVRAEDPQIAALARGNLLHIIPGAKGYVPPLQLVELLERFLTILDEGVIQEGPANVRSVIGRLIEDFKEAGDAHPNERAEWEALLPRLDVCRRSFDEAPFLTRFKIAAGRSYQIDEVEYEGRKMHVHEMQWRTLARKWLQRQVS